MEGSKEEGLDLHSGYRDYLPRHLDHCIRIFLLLHDRTDLRTGSFQEGRGLFDRLRRTKKCYELFGRSSSLSDEQRIDRRNTDGVVAGELGGSEFKGNNVLYLIALGTMHAAHCFSFFQVIVFK